MEDRCSECGGTGGELRHLPGRDASGLFDAVPVCETCTMAAIARLRELVTASETGDDTADAEMDLLFLVAFLKKAGLEIGAQHTGGLEGMEGVRAGLRVLCDSLERQLLCSGCGAAGPESRMHVIPWFNVDLGRYVQTFRCQTCVHHALAETLSRLRTAVAPAELDGLGHLLLEHGVHVHEWLRGDPPDGVRTIFIRTVEMIDAGTLCLRLGATRPVPSS